MIDIRTGPAAPPLWEPGTPRRRPSLIPALIALILTVPSSAAIVAGLHRALKIRYTPPVDVCAGLDATAIAALTKSPPPVAVPASVKQACDFAAGRSALGTLRTAYATSAIEVRIRNAQEIDGGDEDGRQELPGIGQGAWVTGSGEAPFDTCRFAAGAYDANIIVHLVLELRSPYCEPVAVRSAMAASLRATLARLA